MSELRFTASPQSIPHAERKPNRAIELWIPAFDAEGNLCELRIEVNNRNWAIFMANASDV